jgi:bacillolysin
MSRSRWFAVWHFVCVAAGIAAAAFWLAPASAQRGSGLVTIASRTTNDLRDWGSRIDSMRRSGDLRVRTTRDDALVRGRTHQRLDQYHRGVRVFGADIAEQLIGGQVVSVFGNIYDDIAIDPSPTLGPDRAREIVADRAGVELGPSLQPELVVLPRNFLHDQDEHGLAWMLHATNARDSRQYFVDARSGSIVFDFNDRETQRQSSVGRATGVLGDTKKISVSSASGRFLAADLLRPPAITTYDMQANVERLISILNRTTTVNDNDIASDTDNTWTDGAVDDGHVYAGWTYDYYFKRFSRRGLDNANRAMQVFVHPVRRNDVFTLFEQYADFYVNAFYNGNGVVVFGEGLPANVTLGGQSWDFLSGALDVVAHELSHGVTQYSADLIYLNESGALNESFSDIMGTSVEFYFQPPGNGLLRADYLMGEDVIRPGGLRSLSDPLSLGDPDHYSRRFLGTDDNGGVHINCGISNNAFYLAIEGGTNRTSGLSVQGVGGSNREQIERVFYRAFTQLLPANATFSMTRAATIQASRDLFGSNSAAERAVTQAWTAVGVN